MPLRFDFAWILAAGLAALAVAASARAPVPAPVGGQAAPPPARPAALQPRSDPAQDEIEYVPPYLAAALKLGTLGAGAELTLGLIPDALNIRLGGNYLPLKFSGKIKDVDYSFDVTWASVPLALDWHPFGNNFRITGAVLYNRNRARLDANLSENQKIGDHEYTPEEIGTLTGKVDFRNFAPYLGLGFGNAVGGPDTSWNFVFDVGVMFQGAPDVALSADGIISQDPTFRQDLAKEEKSVQDEADKFQFYPVISFGLSYQF